MKSGHNVHGESRLSSLSTKASAIYGKSNKYAGKKRRKICVFFSSLYCVVGCQTLENTNRQDGYLLEILLRVICRCRLHRNRSTSSSRSCRCLVFLPCTLLRQFRQLCGFSSLRISAMVSASVSPNCCSMASKGVLSSQAISMMRSISASPSVFFFCIFITLC